MAFIFWKLHIDMLIKPFKRYCVYRQAERQAGRQTGKQADRQVDKKQTNRQTHKDRGTGRQTDRQVNRQTDRQVNRQTDRQPDKHCPEGRKNLVKTNQPNVAKQHIAGSIHVHSYIQIPICLTTDTTTMSH